MAVEIVGYEFKHAVYVESKLNRDDDFVFVKENIHYSDGTYKPNMRKITNFELPFWVTKPGEHYRNHKEKKPWEVMDNVREYTSNQRGRAMAVVKALGYGQAAGIKTVNRNPYVYGTDINATTLVKRMYKERYKNLRSPFTVAHLDIETDMTGASNNDIIMISVVMGDLVYQVTTKAYIGTHPDYEQDVRDLFDKEIYRVRDEVWPNKFWDKKKERYSVEPFQYKLIQETAEDEADAVCKCFAWVHAQQPDYLSIVNVPFDMGKMARALTRRNINPEDIFCDPRVPKHARMYKLVEGQARIADANGKGAAIPPHQRWHKVYVTASFYVVDQACTRWGIRKHKPNEGKYSLDAILHRVLGIGKLKGDGLVRSTGGDWHRLMQRQHKIYYAVYNMFDNIGAQWHDLFTKDLSQTLAGVIGVSDLLSYGSEGKKLYDDQYFKYLKKGKVLCGISDQMSEEIDELLITLDGWISTLSPSMVSRKMRNKLIKDRPNMLTLIILFVLDIDVKSSYPSTGVWANLDKLTIIRQMCKINGIDTLTTQRAGLDLTAGRVNAIDILQKVCGWPAPQTLMMRFAAERDIKPDWDLPAIADKYCEEEYRTFNADSDSGGRRIQRKYLDV